MRSRQLQRFNEWVIVTMPRRYGKTRGVALTAAAMAVAVPGLRIAIFSRTRDQASSMMDLVGEYLYMIKAPIDPTRTVRACTLRVRAHTLARSR